MLELEGLEFDHCPDCGGVWLDQGEAERMAQRASVDPVRVSEALGGVTQLTAGKRRCPRCARRLRLLNATPELDGCPSGHGWWFDRGELEAFLASRSEGPRAAIERTLERFFGTKAEAAPVESI